MNTMLPEIRATFVNSSKTEAINNILKKEPPTLLTQTWRETPQPELTRTEVRVAWNGDHLWIQTDMEDKDVFSRATSDSQHLWQLGDVFEIFLKPEDAGYYVEMHVTPNNFRLHLRLQPGNIIAVRENQRLLSDFMIHPPRFQTHVEQTSFGWSALVCIPAKEISPTENITPTTRYRASFCRYDAYTDGRSPILSSTSPHSELNFHRRDEWRPLCF